jgi:hypothetical protein
MTMNLETLLQESAPTDHALSAEARARASARVDAAVLRADQRVHLVRRSRRRRTTLVSLVSVAAAGVLTLTPVLDLGGLRGPDSAQAAEVLISAAAAAGSQAGGWPDAAYWHVVSDQLYDGQPSSREIWQSRVGESVLQDEKFDSASEVSGPDAVYTETLGGPANFYAFDWAELYALPTDPVELEKILRKAGEGSGPDPDSELWAAVAALQLESPAPPALRAALWTVASGIPDVDLVGDVTDSLGRPGTAIERDMTEGGWLRERFIIDTATGDLLEAISYDKDDTITWRTTIRSEGPADTAPAIDPPICGPGSVPERSC